MGLKDGNFPMLYNFETYQSSTKYLKKFHPENAQNNADAEFMGVYSVVRLC